MIEYLLNIIAWTSLTGANPLVSIHLGLAVLHALAALCYLRHEGGRVLALCYGLMSAFYVVLAMQHGVAH